MRFIDKQLIIRRASFLAQVLCSGWPHKLCPRLTVEACRIGNDYFTYLRVYLR